MLKRLLAGIIAVVKPSHPFGNRQWVTVSISFVLAVALWFVVTLNTQTYTTDFVVPIRLINFPGGYQLVHDFPQTVQVRVTGQGIKLLYEEFAPEDTLIIDYNSYQHRTHFVGHDNLTVVKTILTDGLTALRVSPDSIPLLKLRKDHKKVPVVAAVKWNMPPSFRLQGPVRIDPDSVIVAGPTDSLARLTEWRTSAAFISPFIDQPMTLRIPLDTLHPYMVSVEEVVVEILPEPFTELALPVPVRAVNLPRFTEVYFEPDSVDVRFLIPLSQADSVLPQLFSVDVDFRNLDDRSPYVLPQVSRSPSIAQLGGINPPMVKYMIISKAK